MHKWITFAVVYHAYVCCVVKCFAHLFSILHSRICEMCHYVVILMLLDTFMFRGFHLV